MKRELPLVSVAIPTFNRAEGLRRAIDSVLGQTYPNIELIISDNASTDNTQLLCTSYSKNYQQIKYHRQNQNIGAVKNFEFAKEWVGGKYFMWLADDDYISTEFVEVCVAHLEADEDVALAAGVAFSISGEGVSIEQRSFSLEMNSGPARAICYFYNVTDNSVFYGLYRTSLIHNSILPPILGGDWVWVAEVMLSGKLIIDNRAQLMRYSGGASSSYRKMFLSLGYPSYLSMLPRTSLIVGLTYYLLTNSNQFKYKLGMRRYIVALLMASACITKWAWFVLRKLLNLMHGHG